MALIPHDLLIRRGDQDRLTQRDDLRTQGEDSHLHTKETPEGEPPCPHLDFGRSASRAASVV